MSATTYIYPAIQISTQIQHSQHIIQLCQDRPSYISIDEELSAQILSDAIISLSSCRLVSIAQALSATTNRCSLGSTFKFSQHLYSFVSTYQHRLSNATKQSIDALVRLLCSHQTLQNVDTAITIPQEKVLSQTTLLKKIVIQLTSNL